VGPDAIRFIWNGKRLSHGLGKVFCSCRAWAVDSGVIFPCNSVAILKNTDSITCRTDSNPPHSTGPLWGHGLHDPLSTGSCGICWKRTSFLICAVGQVLRKLGGVEGGN
jgi:hypothetical protein